ncbi:MAG: MazG family protein [Actinobacteria bacterium]|nr:MazG family protein [Actinomycetota bacterium]
MDRLRSPGGCPWDAEQTHASLVPYAIEEAYEVADAVDSGDPAKLADELGDLLLQVLFHARVAAETGDFDIDDVAATLVAKLKRRHPHVFGDAEVADADEVVTNWQAIKAAERADAGESDHPGGELAAALERIPRGLPAMERATKTVNRLRKAGLDPAALASGLEGEAAPSSPAGGLGAAVLAALDAGLEPETELRRWTAALREAALREGLPPESDRRIPGHSGRKDPS